MTLSFRKITACKGIFNISLQAVFIFFTCHGQFSGVKYPYYETKGGNDE